MYACICETGARFFEGVRTPSNATANFHDPLHPVTQGTGPPRLGLRLEVNCSLRYRERRFSLG
jgi:hypothetical protein